MEESRKANWEIIRMNHMMQIVNATPNLDEVMETVIDALSEFFRFDVCEIFLIDEAAYLLRPLKVYSSTLDEKLLEYLKG